MSGFLLSPDGALLTLLAGVFLIYVECNRPGKVLPGCLGCLLALLALHRLQQLPIHLSSLALGILGLALLGTAIASLYPRSFTLLAAASLAAGLHANYAGVGGRLALELGISLAFVIPTVWLGWLALQARKNKRFPVNRAMAPHMGDASGVKG